MVARAHVGDDGHLAPVKGQAFAKQTATCCFKNSSVDIRVHQYIARTARTTAIAIVNLTAIDVHTIGVGHAHTQIVCLEQVSGETHCCGFAVGARDGNHRNSAVVAIGEHVVDDSFAYIATFAK